MKKQLENQVSHIPKTDRFFKAFSKWWRTQQGEGEAYKIKKITDDEIKNAVLQALKTHEALIMLENHRDNWGLHFSVWRSQILLFHKTFYKESKNDKK